MKTKSNGDILAAARQRMRDFVGDRDWEKFQTPKNLSMALSVEASELLELFQWLSQAQSLAPGHEIKLKASREIADIFIYLVRIADVLDVDIPTAVLEKLDMNEKKHPVGSPRPTPFEP